MLNNLKDNQRCTSRSSDSSSFFSRPSMNFCISCAGAIRLFEPSVWDMWLNLPQYAMFFGWAILSLKKVINLQRSFSHIQLPRLPVRSRRANRFPICKENHIPFRFLVWNQNVAKQPAWVKRFSIFHNISEKLILNVVRQQFILPMFHIFLRRIRSTTQQKWAADPTKIHRDPLSFSHGFSHGFTHGLTNSWGCFHHPPSERPRWTALCTSCCRSPPRWCSWWSATDPRRSSCSCHGESSGGRARRKNGGSAPEMGRKRAKAGNETDASKAQCFAQRNQEGIRDEWFICIMVHRPRKNGCFIEKLKLKHAGRTRLNQRSGCWQMNMWTGSNLDPKRIGNS